MRARHKPSDSAARSSFYSPRRVTGDGNNNGIRRFSRPTGLESRTRPCPPLYHNIAIPRCFHLRGLPRPTNQIRTCGNVTRDRGIATLLYVCALMTIFFPTVFFDLLRSNARYYYERVNVFHFHVFSSRDTRPLTSSVTSFKIISLRPFLISLQRNGR